MVFSFRLSVVRIRIFRIRDILNENCPYKKLTLLPKLFVFGIIVSGYEKNKKYLTFFQNMLELLC